MALFHLSVTQTKRSAGQSAIASAAYRAGERLYSEYYGEYSDYTRKGGVICSDILLPSHAPPEYADRQTLWNAVEKAERGKNAQLAYSFDIALHSDRTLPGLTNPIRSTMRETATSSLSLKHRLTFCPLSAFIRRTGRQGATLPWAAFQAKPLTVFFLNARTSEKCSSALTATPQEVKPAPGWHRTFPARSPSFALSR